jgi:hypothetical protein
MLARPQKLNTYNMVILLSKVFGRYSVSNDGKLGCYIHACGNTFFMQYSSLYGCLTINVPVVYMVRYKVVLRGDYP